MNRFLMSFILGVVQIVRPNKKASDRAHDHSNAPDVFLSDLRKDEKEFAVASFDEV